MPPYSHLKEGEGFSPLRNWWKVHLKFNSTWFMLHLLLATPHPPQLTWLMGSWCLTNKCFKIFNRYLLYDWYDMTFVGNPNSSGNVPCWIGSSKDLHFIYLINPHQIFISSISQTYKHAHAFYSFLQTPIIAFCSSCKWSVQTYKG